MSWRDAVLLLILGVSYAAYEDAKEAHKHSHEAACAAGHTPTCQFVERSP